MFSMIMETQLVALVVTTEGIGFESQQRLFVIT